MTTSWTMSMGETWPQWVEKATHIADMLDLIRYRSQDRAKLLIAIGSSHIIVSKSKKLDPEDAIAILADLQDTIASAIRGLSQGKGTKMIWRIPPR